mmetsp:Transcript_29954/g.71300  ORF Transcript_29954/g.71300 Transcript_29954/m.71300 type:complete len:130 (-) Transcript_29954:28-417(-)
MIGAWWRKNVIEKVHALAYSGKFTVKSPRLFMAIQGLYIAAPLVAGYYIMESVTEGGRFHQGAREITAANREELVEHHKRRMEKAREQGFARPGELASDTRVLDRRGGISGSADEIAAAMQRGAGENKP